MNHLITLRPLQIVFDPADYLRKWKSTSFTVTDDQKRDRALEQLFRFRYLTNEYRYEKWSYRQAWIQLSQIATEAANCACSFLYCINGWFIPRKDWLAYLTYELPLKLPDHGKIMDLLYTSQLRESALQRKFLLLREIGDWMDTYCRNAHWL